MKLPANFDFEKPLWSRGLKLVAGIDEVGRGAWAGPVVAGAVVFPANYSSDFHLYDSKLLSPKQREESASKIRSIAQIGIGVVGVSVINKIGIGKATQIAFQKAVKKLPLFPQHFLIDAFYIKNWPKDNQNPIKKGDVFCASIAAASIVAKVFRDQLMRNLDKKYPQYEFASHKGYGTPNHQKAIKEFSFSPVHRTSFDLRWVVNSNLAV